MNDPRHILNLAFYDRLILSRERGYLSDLLHLGNYRNGDLYAWVTNGSRWIGVKYLSGNLNIDFSQLITERSYADLWATEARYRFLETYMGKNGRII